MRSEWIAYVLVDEIKKLVNRDLSGCDMVPASGDGFNVK